MNSIVIIQLSFAVCVEY